MINKTFVFVAIAIGSAVGLTRAAVPVPEIVARTAQDPVRQQPRELVLALDNPSYQPRIGIPDFVAAGGDAELQAAAKTLAHVLAAHLDFE
jgi:hypothetical protein